MTARKKDILSSVLLVLVSTFLVFVVSTSFTMAWFSSSDTANGTFHLGGAVVVQVSDQQGTLADGDPITLTYAASELLPGIEVLPDIWVLLLQSTTTSVMRARIDTSVQGLTPEQNTQLNTWFRDAYLPQINTSWSVYTDGWFYYLGSAGSLGMVMTQTATDSGLTTPVYGTTFANYTATTDRTIQDSSTVTASLFAGAHNISIDFLTDSFRLPTSIDDSYANATITMTFYVEALQDYLLDGTEQNVLPTILNVKTIMDTLSPTHDANGDLI